MGQVNRDLLRNFLSEHIQVEDLVSRLMTLLEPFFQRAESGGYILAPEASLDPEQVKAAITQATGQEVARVDFVSLEALNHPFTEPPEMTRKPKSDPWDDLQRSLGNSLQSSLWASLGDNFGNHLRLKDGLLARLRKSLKDGLGENLRASLQKSLGIHPPASLQCDLLDNLIDSASYLLGFAIAGKTEVVERLVPLIELLPRAVPLGVKKDEPGVWVVLAA